MHPLAFDKQGRPFPFHRRTRKLLVRLFRNPAARGTCCQVLDGAGEPLCVEVETDYLEFRKLVGNVPGLYRLDQCDDDGVEIDDAPPAYVSIDMTRNALSLDGGGDVNPLVIIEHLVAIQADVMKTMAAQQAALISASAEILRAPYRPALPPVVVEKERDDKDSDEECEVGEHAQDRDDTDDGDNEPADPWAALRPVMDMIEPHVPKLGAFLYEQFIAFLKRSRSEAASPPSASSPAAAPAPTPAPAPAAAVSAPSTDAEPMGAAAGPSSPPSAGHATPADAGSTPRVRVAPAASAPTAASAVVEDDAAMSPASAPSVVEPTAPGEQLNDDAQAHASAIDVVPSTATARTATSSAAAKASATTQRTVAPSVATPTTPALSVASSGAVPRNALPEPTPEQVRHLLEIREQLSVKERAIAENAISRMTPDVLADWLAELSALSVDEATHMLRQMIARIREPRPGGGG